MDQALASAIQLIGSLKVHDFVRVTREGRTNVLEVTQGPRRSDGQYGSPESLQVTVAYPRGYAFEVSAMHLVRVRRGHGWIGGGTEIEKVECTCDPAHAVDGYTIKVRWHHAPDCPIYLPAPE